MPSSPSNSHSGKYVPPDPGGRSRYLIRGLAIAIIVCAVVAAVMMYMLHRVTPPPTPQQQPAGNSEVVRPQGLPQARTPSASTASC